MRLSEMRKIIFENIEQLNYKSEPSSQNGYILIRNIPITVDAIERLSQLTFLSTSINKLRACHNVYNARTSIITMPSGEFEPFRILLTAFQDQCKTIIALADSIVPPIEGQTICIKLLETTNVSDVKKLVSNLEEAFSQTSNLTNYKGSVRFSGFESGSNWINFLIDGSQYMSLLVFFIQIAYVVAKDYINLKLLNQRYQGAVIQNNVNEDMSKLLKEMCNRAINNLKEQENLNLTHEEVERSVLTTMKIATTIIDGNKILPSLTSPLEQQSQFEESANQLFSQLTELKLLASPESVPEQISADNEPID